MAEAARKVCKILTKLSWWLVLASMAPRRVTATCPGCPRVMGTRSWYCSGWKFTGAATM